jgi:AmiR/NasT family two-component response regulator
MTGPRILQNFNGGRGHLIAGDPRVAAALAPALDRLGVSLGLVPIEDGVARIDTSVLRDDTDILFVDADLDSSIGLPAVPEAGVPIPVIAIIGVEAPSRLKSMMQVGATAFLRKPIHGAAVYPALFIGINGFLRRRSLELSLEDQERRRRGRRFVTKAVLKLMHRAGIDDDQAYAILRRESMRRRMSVEEYAAAIVEEADRPVADVDDRAAGILGVGQK